MNNRKIEFVDGKTKVVYSPFRSLQNYKEMHRGTAKTKGVEAALMAAPTLTQARRIVFG
jgi:hypothetical protein